MKHVLPRHQYDYQAQGVNLHFAVFHADGGEGLPRHTHSYSHLVICHKGSCAVRKEGKQRILTPESGAINLSQNEWHEIEALEDGTVFCNVFSSTLDQ